MGPPEPGAAARPNLFLVGQPKSGTTSMHRYLGQHPEIFVCPFKEPRYFARDLHRESDAFHGSQRYFPIRTEEAYLALFRGAAGQALVGEVSPHYLFSREAAERIHAFEPDARILILLRDPVSFLHAWHGEMVARLHEPVRDLAEALELEPRRRRGEELPASVGTPSFLLYSDWVRYAEQLGRYLERFPREQVAVFAFEDLVDRPTDLLRDVFSFLGVDPDFAPRLEVHNPSRVARLRMLRAVARHPRVWRTLRRALPPRLWDRADRLATRIFTREAPRAPLDPALRADLRARFRPEVRAVSELVGRDFAARWGYADGEAGARPARAQT